MYVFIGLAIKSLGRGGSLVPQTRGLIHQFGVWLGRDNKGSHTQIWCLAWW